MPEVYSLRSKMDGEPCRRVCEVPGVERSQETEDQADSAEVAGAKGEAANLHPMQRSKDGVGRRWGLLDVLMGNGRS